MRRSLLAAAAVLGGSLMLAPARAANCPAVLTDCPTVNANNGNFGGVLKARSLVWLSAGGITDAGGP